MQIHKCESRHAEYGAGLTQGDTKDYFETTVVMHNLKKKPKHCVVSPICICKTDFFLDLIQKKSKQVSTQVKAPHNSRFKTYKNLYSDELRFTN